MSLVFKWNCEKYSLQDVLSFLSEKGYTFVLHRYDGGIDQVVVNDTDITIDVPLVDTSVDQIFSAVHFNNYPKTEVHDASKKIYETLRRRFGKKKTDRKTRFVKDEHSQKALCRQLQHSTGS